MFLGRLAVFMGGRGVRFCFVVFALRMVMSGLMMMVGGGLMRGGGIVVVLASRMLGRLSHSKISKKWLVVSLTLSSVPSCIIK
jgi:hypothetical protein